jgi:broad specificity phosphatase PhoE
MGTLYLVRHGQASFGAADYDQLSPLGQRQCERLGQWFAARGIAFDAVLTGTLRRHLQSLAAIEAGLARTHEALRWPGLNEYDSQALVRAVHEGPTVPAAAPDSAREHFRLLRQGLARWMAGEAQPQGMPSHAEFRAGVVGALDHVRERHAEGTTLLVSSGGPISVALGHVLGLQADAVIDLNMHLRNSALCELRVTRKRHALVSFNALPHLDAQPEHAAWITHA